VLRNSHLSQTGCPATQYQLTALRIQILYSCARTFLEQKSRALAQSNSRPMARATSRRILHYIQVCCTRLSHYLLPGPLDSGRKRPANDNAIGIFSVKPATGVASAACLASCRVARPMLPIRFPPASVCRFSTDTKI
jgi:hypothetical protein